MSNDVIIPNVPTAPAAVFRGKGHTDIVAEEMGLGYSVVSASGNKFVLKHAGDKHVILNPPKGDPDSDGFPSRYFDFILLRSPKLPSNFYYKNGYEEGSTKPPTCTSTDGIAPDDNVTEKQSAFCQTCAHFEWKNLPNGRKGRECQQRMRLAVLPMVPQMKATIGTAINEPVLFNIPAASMRALTEFDRQMNAKHGGNAPYYAYVMRAKLDPSVSWPRLQYQLVDFLAEDYAELVMLKREEPLAYRILGLSPDGRNLMRRGEALAAPVQTIQVEHKTEQQFQPVQEDKPELPMLELKAEKIQTIEPQVPLGDDMILPVTPKEPEKPKLTVVPDAPVDIDALVASLRPHPPGT